MDKTRLALISALGILAAPPHTPIEGLFGAIKETPKPRGVSRATGDSKRGRQIASQNKPMPEHGHLSKEQIEWNAAIEAKRLAKKEKKNVKA